MSSRVISLFSHISLNYLFRSPILLERICAIMDGLVAVTKSLSQPTHCIHTAPTLRCGLGVSCWGWRGLSSLRTLSHEHPFVRGLRQAVQCTSGMYEEEDTLPQPLLAFLVYAQKMPMVKRALCVLSLSARNEQHTKKHACEKRQLR